jgi:hypothetical protein
MNDPAGEGATAGYVINLALDADAAGPETLDESAGWATIGSGSAVIGEVVK